MKKIIVLAVLFFFVGVAKTAASEDNQVLPRPTSEQIINVCRDNAHLRFLGEKALLETLKEILLFFGIKGEEWQQWLRTGYASESKKEEFQRTAFEEMGKYKELVLEKDYLRSEAALKEASNWSTMKHPGPKESPIWFHWREGTMLFLDKQPLLKDLTPMFQEFQEIRCIDVVRNFLASFREDFFYKHMILIEEVEPGIKASELLLYGEIWKADDILEIFLVFQSVYSRPVELK